MTITCAEHKSRRATMASTRSHAGLGDPTRLPGPHSRPAGSGRWGVPVQLGERRVLHRGRRLWLRVIAWLLLLFFLTAAAFGLPLQAAVDRLPPGNAMLAFLALLLACTAALGSLPSPSGWVRDAGRPSSRSTRRCPGSSPGRPWAC